MAARKNILLRRVEELLEVERRFKILFGAHPIPTWLKFLTDDDRLIMGLVNDAYTRATGISVAAYINRVDAEVWIGEEPEAFNISDRLVLRTGTQHRIADKAINPKNRKAQYWVGWKWPYTHQGNIIGVVGCAESFSEEFWNQYGADMLIAMGEF